jgi:NAD(P)-dependent dehydrogenase (short-subunit alcohol dehydrogenase family)
MSNSRALCPDLSGRAVIITGAAGGVGQIVTRRWLEAGADVLAVDHSDTAFQGLRDGLPTDLAAKLAALATDVTTEAGASQMAPEAERAFGRPPDTLIHLVGSFAMGPVDGPDAPKDWDRMLALNLTSNFHCYRAVLPALRKRGGGWIVGMGSRVGVTPVASLAAYAASKAGLIALTQSLSTEVREAGIHVNMILASTIDTPANRRDMGADQAVNWVTGDDIADATFYLCSDQARAVHGATLELYANA